ncbi:MAG: hypothetical protein H6624_02525 [Bdellovibrionaceae bacterium]|nr:hypothetical protein [Bdellovibrionales bacterium]MCB9083186.1 hypothetical protein [Pseudobdellovibrionaceae bacterium]
MEFQLPGARSALCFRLLFVSFLMIASLGCGSEYQVKSQEGERERVARVDQLFSTVLSLRVGVRQIRDQELTGFTKAQEIQLRRLALGAEFLDIDQDGKGDRVILRPKYLTFYYGNGSSRSVKLSNDDLAIATDFDVVYLGNQANRPSFVVSMVRPIQSNPGFVGGSSWFGRSQQVLITNGQSGMTSRVLNLSILGRGVRCTKLGFYSAANVLCMFASYGDSNWVSNSTLLEISPNGTTVDRTHSSGLNMFGGKMGRRYSNSGANANYQNGLYMMGFAWVDLNGDGLPDLVGNGQHSQMFSAVMKREGSGFRFINAKWFGQVDEYMGLSSIEDKGFPCVYVNIERRESRRKKGDYLTCYDKLAGKWNLPPMPNSNFDNGIQQGLISYLEGRRRIKFFKIGPSFYTSTIAVLGSGERKSMLLKMTPRWVEVEEPEATNPILPRIPINPNPGGYLVPQQPPMYVFPPGRLLPGGYI